MLRQNLNPGSKGEQARRAWHLANHGARSGGQCGSPWRRNGISAVRPREEAACPLVSAYSYCAAHASQGPGFQALLALTTTQTTRRAVPANGQSLHHRDSCSALVSRSVHCAR